MKIKQEWVKKCKIKYKDFGDKIRNLSKKSIICGAAKIKNEIITFGEMNFRGGLCECCADVGEEDIVSEYLLIMVEKEDEKS